MSAKRRHRKRPSSSPKRSMKVLEKRIDRALRLLNQKLFEEAKQIFQDLLRTHPEHHEILHGMGLYYLLTGEYQEAIPYFDRTIEQAPSFTYAYFNKAVACKQLMEVKQTIRAFEKVVEIGDPQEGYVQQAKDFLLGFEELVAKKEGEPPPQSDIPLVNYYRDKWLREHPEIY